MLLTWAVLAVLAALPGGTFPCDGPLLEPGLPLRASLSEGQTRTFALDVPVGQLARVVVTQGCTDFAVQVRTPAGEVLEFDTPNGPQGSEIVEWIAETSGRSCIQVPHVGDQPPGQLEIVLEALRPANAEDRLRVSAFRNAYETYRALDLRQVPLCRLSDCSAALARWQAVGQADWQSFFELELALAAEKEAETRERLKRAFELAKEATNPHLLHLIAAQLPAGDPRALEGFETSVRAWAAGGCRAKQLRSLHGAAKAARQLGDFERAAGFLAEAFEVARSLDDPAELAQTWMLEGVHRMAKPEPPELALAAYGEAQKQLARMTDAVRQRELENELTASRAVALYYQGNTDQALQELEALLKRLVAAKARTAGPGELGAYYTLGSLFLTFGAVDRAAIAYRQGLGLAESRKLTGWRVRFSISLATTLRQADRDQDAGELYQEAIRLADEGGPDQAAALCGLGALELKARRLEPAQIYLEQAEEIWRRRQEPERLAEVLLERARVARESGDRTGALARTEEGLRRLPGTGLSVIRAALQELQARLLADAEDLEPALHAVEAAIRFDEVLRSSVVSHDLRTHLLARRRARYELEIDLLLRLAERSPSRAAEWREKALRASEKARARSFAELLAESDLTRALQVPPDLAREYERLRGDLEAVQRQWLDRAATLPASSLEVQRLGVARDQALAAFEQTYERIREHQLRQRSHRLPPTEPPDLREIQSSLAEGDALLEYVLGDRGGAVFVVTSKGMEARRLAVGAGEVEGRQEDLQSAIEGRETRDDDEFREAASWLYQQLLAPAEAWTRDRSRLIVVPDGPLHRLNFETLLLSGGEAPEGAPLRYAVERWAISYVPSATVRMQLLRQPSKSGRQIELLALADPAPPAAPGSGVPTGSRRGRTALLLPSLAGARREVQEIGGLFGPRAKVLVGEAASEAAVQATAARARYLHFAVHNYFDEVRPSSMGLVLAPAGEGDGFLGLAEIESMHLDAELVVLSACDSARGEQKAGEGVIGLVRAFMTAGAENVAVSLWLADDEETPALMVAFYRGLLAGGSQSEALREAKLALIARSGRAGEPEVWAPFILFGAR